ncbi:hypothetical protein D3C76_1395960 [compost metagenome]
MAVPTVLHDFPDAFFRFPSQPLLGGVVRFLWGLQLSSCDDAYRESVRLIFPSFSISDNVFPSTLAVPLLARTLRHA